MNEALQTALRKLRLAGLAQSLEVRLQEAAGHSLNHTEFLELLLQDELAVRADRLMNRRVKAASFRELPSERQSRTGSAQTEESDQGKGLNTMGPLRYRITRTTGRF